MKLYMPIVFLTVLLLSGCGVQVIPRNTAQISIGFDKETVVATENGLTLLQSYRISILVLIPGKILSPLFMSLLPIRVMSNVQFHLPHSCSLIRTRNFTDLLSQTA